MFLIDSATALRVLREDDAAELFALTDANRAYLRRWLPWVDLVTSEEDSAASALTGPGVTRWPRPRGRSGWVTTPAVSCRDPSSASSVGTANRGVPKNTTRRVFTICPGVRAS